MLFGTKNKALLKQQAARIHELESELAASQAALLEAQHARELATAAQSALRKKVSLAEGIYGNFEYFGQSLGQLQQTLHRLADSLREEKDTAMRAAAASTIFSDAISSIRCRGRWGSIAMMFSDSWMVTARKSTRKFSSMAWTNSWRFLPDIFSFLTS